MISENKIIRRFRHKVRGFSVGNESIRSGSLRYKKSGTAAAALLMSLTLIIAMVSGIAFQSSSGSILPAASALTQPTGIMVPLYTYPGSTWTTVGSIKTAYPAVPILAIINPDSGPGSFKDSNYVTGIANLQKAGVQVIGYVATGYGQRSIKNITADVDTYKSFYPSITGIFFDEMTNEAGSESIYQAASDYAKSLGFSYTIGNPGTDTSTTYINTVSNVVYYETDGMPVVSSLDMHGFSKSHFSVIAYGVSSLPSTTAIKALTQKAQWIYITNDVLDNPYDTLPSYLSGEAQILSGIATSSIVTVKSVDLAGVAFSGMWTEVYNSSGALIKSGYTPLQFTAQAGQTYTVIVDSAYANIVFDHWNNGSTSTTRTITAPSTATSMTLLAYYST